MLPPAPEAPRAPAVAAATGGSARSSRWWIILVLGVLLAMVLGVAALVTVPYVAIRPGSARPVSESITVLDAPSFPPAQSIAYTTVQVSDARLLEAVAGWLDDDVDVLPRQRVRGDRSDEESRRYNAQLMDTSKLTAITVAQEALGLEVEITTSGAIVRAIADGSPAAQVLELDDVITAVDGELVDEPGELGPLLQPGGPGATHQLTVERPPGSGEHVEVPVTTVADPEDPTRALIGIQPEDRIVAYDFPIDVAIDSGTVGGPSAGLAFTLAVMDVLTPGELTGDHKVATTGTISMDGLVGPVGGGAQKAITVRNAGYDTFLVPSAELEEVREAIGDDLTVIPVDTLDEALDALADLGGNARSLALPAASSGT